MSSTRALSFIVVVCPRSVLPSGPGISMPRTALLRIILSCTSCTITYRSADSTHPWRIPDETPKGLPRRPLVFTAVLMSVYMVLTPCIKVSGRPKARRQRSMNGHWTLSKAFSLSSMSSSPPSSGASLLMYLIISVTRSMFSSILRPFWYPICGSPSMYFIAGDRHCSRQPPYTRYSMVVTDTGRYMAQSERSAPGLSLKSVVIMAVREASPIFPASCHSRKSCCTCVTNRSSLAISSTSSALTLSMPGELPRLSRFMALIMFFLWNSASR